jgi:hypothetical protein
MVWGPPGTGKTRVLARAIEDLVAQGKRVLLVSTANVAVDNALLSVINNTKLPAGSVLRVGTAHLDKIARNPEVNIELRTKFASKEVDDEINEISSEIEQSHTFDVDIEALNHELATFDVAEFNAAAVRVQRDAQHKRLLEKITSGEHDLATTRQDYEKAGALHAMAQQEYQKTLPAQEIFTEIANQKMQISATDDQLVREEEVLRHEFSLAQQANWFRRLKKLRNYRLSHEFHVLTYQDWPRQRAALLARYEAEIAAAYPITPQVIDEVKRQLDISMGRVDSCAAAISTANAVLARLADELAILTAAGLPSLADFQLVEHVQQRDYVRKWNRRATLLAARENYTKNKGKLEERLRFLNEKSAQLRNNARATVLKEAKVVATTIARCLISDYVAKEKFDVVFIDEAGAVKLPEAVAVLHQARTSAVLLGDFLQLGPVYGNALEKAAKSGKTELTTWITTDPFTHMGIFAPADAQRQPGCVCLQHQFRFGPKIRRIANDVIYESLRDGSEILPQSGNRDTDIILVDVSGLDLLADPDAQRGNWWPVGTLLARALAQVHQSEHEVGVVTPYKHQKEATIAALQDHNLISNITVGTVHAMQGREFPTVIYDTVDAGNGWLAKASSRKKKFERDGVKQFGVAITRTQERLYVIIRKSAVQLATDGPLHELNKALQRGDVEVWDAASMLGVARQEPTHDAAEFARVSSFLRKFVKVSEILSEKTFHDKANELIESSTSSVWMWAPWVYSNARKYLAALTAAVNRGVRVTIFIRPDAQQSLHQESTRTALFHLHATGATIIRSHLEHRKILISDDSTVLIGSLNTLSHNPNTPTREIMVAMHGRNFVEKLYEHLETKRLSVPTQCRQCSLDMEIRRRGGKATELFWHCPTCQRGIDIDRTSSWQGRHPGAKKKA